MLIEAITREQRRRLRAARCSRSTSSSSSLYILLNLLFSFGMRLPYSRWSDVLLNFLRDCSEPYLRVFRKFIPPIGAFDFSPMIAIIVLYIVQSAGRQCHPRLSRSCTDDVQPRGGQVDSGPADGGVRAASPRSSWWC